jgi:predicted AAA+ superfamily ATPase
MLDPKSYHDILTGHNLSFIGAITEDYVASCLYKNNEFIFYHSNIPSIEIDFILSKPDGLYAIEVKSRSRRRSISFETVLERNRGLRGIKISKDNVFRNDRYVNIPHYMAFLIK